MREFDESENEELDEFEDGEFPEMDAFIEYLRTLPRADTFLVNPKRVREMRYAFGMVKRVLLHSDCGAKVTCEQDEFEPSIGGVIVEGVTIEIADSEGFKRAARFADNVETFPLVNGRVRMEFTFRRILVPLN